VLAFALIVWFESGIEGFPNYCQAEGDINGIIPALSFKHLNAGHPSPNDEYPDKRINSKDPWGNTYQHEMLEDPQNKSVQFRVYSMGEDGRSASRGNDPDDINSWDEHHREFYNRAHIREAIPELAIEMMILILPMFLVVHCLHIGVRAVWRWKRSGKS